MNGTEVRAGQYSLDSVKLIMTDNREECICIRL